MKGSTILALLILVLPAPTILLAQTDSGSISGTVKDEQGRPLPGTAVTARDSETGVERTMLTGSTGAYYLSPLRPGIYDVTFKLEGFMTRVEQKIAVNVGTQITLNEEMIEGTADVKVSRPAEQIEVLAPPTVETSKSHVSSLVTQQQVEGLPLNGRNFLELSFLTPGVSPAPTFDPSKGRVVEIATPGSMGRSASVVVDGMDDNDEVTGGVLQNLSQDAVGEFQVLTHGFSAATGRSSSSVVNVITKSGTNDLHGGAFVFYRDSALQARNPLLDASTQEPPFDREQTGLSVGGPLVKDKAFWFASYEYTNENAVTAAAIRNASTESFTPILAPTPLYESLATFRFDYRINNSVSLFARYSYQGNTINGTSWGTAAPITDTSNFQTAANQLHSVVSGWTHILSNSKINDFHVAEVHYYNTIDPQTPGMGLVFPSIAIGPTNFVPTWTRMNRVQLKDDFTWTAGNHLVKLGGEFQIVRSEYYGPGNRYGIVYLGLDFAATGRDNDIPVNFASMPISSSTGFVPDVNNDLWAGYVQDDWHIGKGLTLNLGLRYELDTQSNGANDQNERDRVHFYPNDNDVRHKDWNNFGPRLGLAWDLHNNGKTIVRGGYGIYYDRMILNVPYVERLYNGVNVKFDNYSGSTLEHPFENPIACVPALGIYILSNDLQNPRVQQFGAGVERVILPNLRVSADYARSRGDHFLVAPEVNCPRTDVHVNPNISDSVTEVASAGKMSYDGLLISATMRMWKGLAFQLSYTLARMSTVADDEFLTWGDLDAADPLKSYGASGNQDTHRIVVNGTYQLPRGFQVSGIFTYASGIPFNIVTFEDFLGDGSFDRFPLLPRNAGGRQVRTGAELNRWITIFNTSNDPAIVAMRQNCGKTQIPPVPECQLPFVDSGLKFTDNFINLDLRFSKTFPIGKFAVEPIVEIFNVFNVTNIRGTDSGALSGYQNNIESPEFGKPVSTAGGAFGQGGPRAVQFAVRFQF